MPRHPFRQDRDQTAHVSPKLSNLVAFPGLLMKQVAPAVNEARKNACHQQRRDNNDHDAALQSVDKTGARGSGALVAHGAALRVQLAGAEQEQERQSKQPWLEIPHTCLFCRVHFDFLIPIGVGTGRFGLDRVISPDSSSPFGTRPAIRSSGAPTRRAWLEIWSRTKADSHISRASSTCCPRTPRNTPGRARRRA